MNQGAAGLYLHVPFCSRVCPYCDFAVRTGDRARRGRFVDHLVGEIALHRAGPLRFDTIYLGGGTPSSLEPGELVRILEAARTGLAIEPGARVFLEANPEDATPAALEAWRSAGVHTLSLGIQSLDPGGLAFLQRGHDVEQARAAVSNARQVGFPTVSIDLIYGLPGQTVEDWRRQMDGATALGPHHISCYQLTIHPRTRFALLEKRGTLRQLPADEQAVLFRETHRHLNASGYQGYEVSQFASSEAHRSRHNMKYWDHTPYLGLGPSAHSFADGRRWWNLRRTDPWQEAVARGELPIEADERLGPAERALEVLMTGLRTYAGVDLDELRERSGVEIETANRRLLADLQARRLARVEGRRVIPTLEGLALADSVTAMFEIPPPRADATPGVTSRRP